MRAVALGLVGLMLAACGVGGGASGVRGADSAGAPGRPVVAGSGGGSLTAKAAGFASARDGFNAAESAARAWDFSARLARIEGTAIDNGYMLGDWSYTFYSPFKRDKALLVIWDGFRTQAFEQRKDPFAREIFGGTFEIDSRQAIAIAEKNGLKSRRIHRIDLSEDNPQLRLQWTILAAEGEFAVDGHTGQLLKKPN